MFFSCLIFRALICIPVCYCLWLKAFLSYGAPHLDMDYELFNYKAFGALHLSHCSVKREQDQKI